MNENVTTLPAQHQNRQPGIESVMTPQPASEAYQYEGANKLLDKVAIITGGDSGIGKSVAIMFAKEGADIVIVYLDEHDDARETQRIIESVGRKCLIIATDVGEEENCKMIVDKTIERFGHIDVLVNNAAEQHPVESILDITEAQLHRTFRTNLYSMFFMAKAVLPYLKRGSSIINTTSVTAYRGSPKLIDYSATKGSITAFTRSLSGALVKKGIRVNAVAPGPIWTPLIPSTFDEEKVANFGADVPMERPGQPDEVAPCYVFLASKDSSYMTGQVLHPNGGEVING